MRATTEKGDWRRSIETFVEVARAVRLDLSPEHVPTRSILQFISVISSSLEPGLLAQNAATQHGPLHPTVEVQDERNLLHALPPEEPDLRLCYIDGQIVVSLMTPVELDMREHVRSCSLQYGLGRPASSRAQRDEELGARV
jgi:hypothetical protein